MLSSARKIRLTLVMVQATLLCLQLVPGFSFQLTRRAGTSGFCVDLVLHAKCRGFLSLSHRHGTIKCAVLVVSYDVVVVRVSIHTYIHG